MNITWSFDQTEINWSELSELYKIAPLGNTSPEGLSVVFTNSRFKCFVFENKMLIGAGRALADGLDCSYICDVAVHPGYQGIGLGRKVVENLIHQSQGHKKIILYATPGKEGFYTKLGFKKMNTAMAIFQDSEQALTSGIIS